MTYRAVLSEHAIRRHEMYAWIDKLHEAERVEALLWSDWEWAGWFTPPAGARMGPG